MTLLVASPTHMQVRVTGLARWFPAHTVHAKNSGVVVDGDHCKLKATDHYHVRTVHVSLDALTKPGSPGQVALAALLEDRTTGITAFQREMRKLTRPLEDVETRASLPVTRTHTTVINGAGAIQQGDRSRADVTFKYVIEEIELPVCELLAVNEGLVKALINVALAPTGDVAACAFVPEALAEAGRADDLALLNYSANLYGETSVLGLFGTTAVTNALAVIIGDHNQITTDLSVRRGGCSLNDGPASLQRIRKDASDIRAAQAAESLTILSAESVRLLRAATEPWTVDRPASGLDAPYRRSHPPTRTRRRYRILLPPV